jgi:O-antigen/teichoic acid export membrane protein
MSDSVRDRAIRGILTVGVRTVVVRILGLLGTIVLARLLDPSKYGILALGTTIVVLSKFLSDGGLAPGLIRRETPPARAELEAVLGLQLGVCAVVFALVALATQLGSPDPDDAWALTLYALVPMLDAPRTPTAITLERELSWGVIVRAEIAEALVYNLLAVGLVAAGLGVVGASVAAAVKSVVGTSLMVRNGPLGLLLPRPSWKLVRPLLRFGVLFQAAWLITLIRDEGLNLLLAGLSGTAALGAWALARRMLIVLTLLAEAAWRVSLPGMARLLETGEDPRALLGRGLSLAAVAAGFPLAVLVGTTPALVPVLFGPGWEETQQALPLLAGGLAVGVPIGLALNSLLWAQDDAKTAFKLGIPPVILIILVAALLIPEHGAVGAGIGWLVGCLAYVFSASWYAHNIFRGAAVRALLAPCAAAATGAGAGWMLCDSIEPAGLALVVAGTVALSIYVGGLALVDRQSLMRFVSVAKRSFRKAPAPAS